MPTNDSRFAAAMMPPLSFAAGAMLHQRVHRHGKKTGPETEYSKQRCRAR